MACVWAGIVLAQGAVWHAFVASRELGPGWVLGVAAAGAAATCGFACTRRWVPAFMLAALCAGGCLGLSFWIGWRADTSLLSHEGGSRIVEVLSDESVGSFGASSRCRLCDGAAAGALVEVNWPSSPPIPPIGRRVRVFGSVRPPTPDERGLRACRAGEVGTLTVRTLADGGWAGSVRGIIGRARVWAVGRMAEVTGPGGDLLTGVVLGDRRRLAGSTIDADFRTTGLTHLIAVSGSHLIVVAAVVTWLLTTVRTDRRLRVALVVGIVGAYVVFTGIQMSAVRSWLMAVSAAVAGLSGRRTESASALAVTAGGMLLVSPSAAFDLGFQLSVVAVAGLALFGRLAESWTRQVVPSRVRGLAAPVSMTLVAVTATIPVTVPAFGMVSLISPVANLLVGPLVACTLVAGLGALGLRSVWPAGGGLALHLAAVPSAWAAGWRAGHTRQCRSERRRGAQPWSWRRAQSSCGCPGRGPHERAPASWPCCSWWPRQRWPSVLLSAMVLRSRCSTLAKAMPSSCGTALTRYSWIRGPRRALCAPRSRVRAFAQSTPW